MNIKFRSANSDIILIELSVMLYKYDKNLKK